jgi:hypothetical protein
MKKGDLPEKNRQVNEVLFGRTRDRIRVQLLVKRSADRNVATSKVRDGRGIGSLVESVGKLLNARGRTNRAVRQLHGEPGAPHEFLHDGPIAFAGKDRRKEGERGQVRNRAASRSSLCCYHASDPTHEGFVVPEP